MAQQLHNAHVLVVEDDTDQMELMALLMEEFGCRCETASCVQEARDQLARRRFDLVVSDYDLGDGTASDLMDAVRDPQRFVVVTAQGTVPLPGTVMLFRKPLHIESFRRTMLDRLQQLLTLLPRLR